MRQTRGWKFSFNRVQSGRSEDAERGAAGFFRHLISHPMTIVVIIGLTLAMFFCEKFGLFTGFETAQLDSLLKLHSRAMSEQIVIVEINEDDYEHIFLSTSPLNAKKALELVAEVKKYNPSVIGVDLDTSDWLRVCDDKFEGHNAQECSDLRRQIDEVTAVPAPAPGSMKQPTSIIWAAVPRTADLPLQLLPVLGQLPLDPASQGVPQFPVDRDGTVRHYESRVQISPGTDTKNPDCYRQEKDDKCFFPTFARAILRKYPGSTPLKNATDEKVIFNFYGDRYRFPIDQAGSFFQGADREPHSLSQEDLTRKTEIDEARKALFEGKIVLIGGAYHEARDEYFTPLGVMKGVELNALAIQSDLGGGGIREVNEILAIVFDLAIGLFIVYIFYRLEGRPRLALRTSLAIIPVAMLCSLVAFKTFAYWFNFIPLALGVILHELVELSEASSELQHKLESIPGKSVPEAGREDASVTTAVIEHISSEEDRAASTRQEAPQRADKSGGEAHS
ncbi:MAG: CHASE2 domain-containing protein [Candidatus Acidiferrum sp.]